MLYEVITYPYNVNVLTQRQAMERLAQPESKNAQVQELLAERERLRVALSALEGVIEVLPSDANFLMTRFRDAAGVFQYLTAQGIIVRDRSKVARCESCLRITIV